MNPEEWAALKKRVAECQRCPIRASCIQPVFGAGAEVTGRIMIVGEAPGANEDQLGVPFVGASGQFLNKLLEGNKIERASVFVTNVLKCRPPENRAPAFEEVQKCSGYLVSQISHLQPKVIVALGGPAAEFLLSPTGKKVKMGDVRGRAHRTWAGRVLPTWHPAYFLRSHSSSVKREMERDLRRARDVFLGKED